MSFRWNRVTEFYSEHQEIIGDYVHGVRYGFFFDGEEYHMEIGFFVVRKVYKELYTNPTPAPIVPLSEYDWKKRRS